MTARAYLQVKLEPEFNTIPHEKGVITVSFRASSPPAPRPPISTPLSACPQPLLAAQQGQDASAEQAAVSPRGPPHVWPCGWRVHTYGLGAGECCDAYSHAFPPPPTLLLAYLVTGNVFARAQMRRFGNPDSAGSQFIICMGDMKEELDGHFAAFGKVDLDVCVLRRLCGAASLVVIARSLTCAHLCRRPAGDAGHRHLGRDHEGQQTGHQVGNTPLAPPSPRTRRAESLQVKAVHWCACVFASILTCGCRFIIVHLRAVLTGV